MRPISLWNIVEGFAAMASIISLVALLVGISDTWKVVISVLLIVSAVIVLIASIKLRQPTAHITKRTEMMEKGEAIIRGTMRTLVMFGGDMSWAANYAPAIKSVTNMGKTVVVIYPESKAPHVLENAALLANNGADLNPIGDDTRLRGFLVDPDNRTDARFWLATRKLKKQGASSEAGVPGGLADYAYVTREFRADRDPELIDALLTVYRVVCP
jgi:hypothetical protein